MCIRRYRRSSKTIPALITAMRIKCQIISMLHWMVSPLRIARIRLTWNSVKFMNFLQPTMNVNQFYENTFGISKFIFSKFYHFPALTNSFHPIHLHGHSFQVIDMGTRDQLNSGRTAFANATHAPVIKDTVVIPRGGFVRFRFRATNPGYWIFHCHFEYHHVEHPISFLYSSFFCCETSL